MRGVGRIAGSALLVMTSTLGSAILGFGRELINARLYGTHWELDTFLAAAAVPTVLFGVFNGALVSALVPVFSGLIADGKEEQAWNLASTVFNVLFLVLLAGAVLGYVFAPWYVPLIAHGFPAPQLGVAIRMTRWLMPSIIATSLAGVTSAMLNAHHRFSSAALQGMAMNIVTIAVVLALNAKIGIYALTLGTSLGLFVQLLIQMPEFIRIGRYRLQIDLRNPALGQIWHLLGPIILGSAAGQIALFFDRFFASALPPGSISGMNYAIRIMGVPLQIFAAAIATVIFPLLSAQFAGSDHNGLQRSMKTALGVVNLITIPAVGICIVLAHPIVATLFFGGAFDRGATDLCALLLPFAALGLIPQASAMVLTRCSFAGREGRWTVAASVTAVAVNIVLSMVLLPSMGARGLLLANAASQWLQFIALLFLVRAMVTGLRLRELVWPALRVAVAAGGMSALLVYLKWTGIIADGGDLAHSPQLVLEVVGSFAVFLILARLLRVDELDFVWRLVADKTRRLRRLNSRPKANLKGAG